MGEGNSGRAKNIISDRYFGIRVSGSVLEEGMRRNPHVIAVDEVLQIPVLLSGSRNLLY